MKGIEELNFPQDIRYSEDHEWAKMEDGKVRIGISDFAQDQLGDIVFVDLPEVGDTFEKGDEFGTVESVKAASEIYIPMSGEVTAVNMEIEDSPELINNSPYESGWLIEILPDDPEEFESLMTVEDYLEKIKQTED